MINLGDLTKPMTVLIEKISDATGGALRPWQIRRIAKAEADAALIAAEREIKVTEMQRRAMVRFVAEEGVRQQNMEDIIIKSLPHVIDEAHAENIEDDWITAFFDKARLISDDQMQKLWSKVLAGEANRPGRFSKRAVALLSTLAQTDTVLFGWLCRFVWDLGGLPVPFVYDYRHPFYKENVLGFQTLTHLEEAGLIRFDAANRTKSTGVGGYLHLSYFGRNVYLSFPREHGNTFKFGSVMLTSVGRELAPIVTAAEVEGAFEFTCEQFATQPGVKLSLEKPEGWRELESAADDLAIDDP